MALGSVILEILKRPNSLELLNGLVLFVVPLWIAVFVGVLVGWTWKPKWADEFFYSKTTNGSSTKSVVSYSSSSSLFSVSGLDSLKNQLSNCLSWVVSSSDEETEIGSPISDCSSSQLEMEKSNLVVNHDLEVLYKLVQEKDGGPAWIQMMDRSTPTMGYQAWRRDPETGPPQYRTRTVFEDTTPEIVRDFFWDDEFRPKWDDMLIHSSTLEECPTTGTMVVQWVRKFPFFCSDREYIIGRRIWESGRTYYCVTKGVPCSSVPRRNKPRRVDLYYSSWCIRAVESKRGDGQLTACEVLLFHHEDMGIPWEIAKLGVRQGMWGAVKKIEPGVRAYKKQRAAAGSPISRGAFMSQINTKVSLDYLRSLDEKTSTRDLSEVETIDSSEKPRGRNIPKLLVVGGAIAVACTIDRGLLTKALIFGVARRFANIGKKL